MPFEPTAVILPPGQSTPLPRGSSVISHAKMSLPPPVVVLCPLSAVPLSPLCLTLGPCAKAFTSTSLSSPTVPPLVAQPNLALPIPEYLAFPATIVSIVLATLTQQVQSFSLLTQEMQTLAQAFQSQLSALIPSPPAPSAAIPFVLPSHPTPFAFPTPQKQQ